MPSTTCCGPQSGCGATATMRWNGTLTESPLPASSTGNGPPTGMTAQPVTARSRASAKAAALQSGLTLLMPASVSRRRQQDRGHPAAPGAAHLDLGRDQRQRGALEVGPGLPGEREPELRALARLAPRLQPAAVQPGVLAGDRQAEPGAADGPGPRRVGPPEPVEHQRVMAGLEPYAVVAHRDRDRVPVGADGDHDVAARTVPDGGE